MESCEVCGFVWESVPAGDIAGRVDAGVRGIIASLAASGPATAARPTADRWSQLEYAAHVRDVLLHVRDRFVIGLVEDDPVFKPLYRDERVALGLYAGDDIESVARGLGVAAALFCQMFRALSDAQLVRPCQYAYPTPRTRSLLWMAQQVVHEIEHHARDIVDNERLPTTAR